MYSWGKRKRVLNTILLVLLDIVARVNTKDLFAFYKIKSSGVLLENEVRVGAPITFITCRWI